MPFERHFSYCGMLTTRIQIAFVSPFGILPCPGRRRSNRGILCEHLSGCRIYLPDPAAGSGMK
jgi:hypothetical protein